MHTAVLVDEVLRYLKPSAGESFVDATVGAAGHSLAILEKTAPDGRLLALDQDPGALELAAKNLEPFGSRALLVRGNFREIERIAAESGFPAPRGVLADIGISSMMVDDRARGFSFMGTGPLDMRMDPAGDFTAADIVNTFAEKEIADILYQYGEERQSRPIARWIVRSRPLHTTDDLVRAVSRAIGGRHGRIHPATRTFQALRIRVNDELKSLELFLDGAMRLLPAGARLAVISFHSLEDRIVKNRFRDTKSGTVLTRKVVQAADDEIRRNPRARSAKLRVWEKN